MKEGGYIRALDGVRALAIILVMTFHAGITYFGWMGVQLFFVLSGYLITGILWKDKFREEPLSDKFKRFWARRSLRIFPLYFGYLIVLGCTYLDLNFPSYYPDYAAYLFTYTFNYTRLLPEWHGNPLFTHLWSLCIEEQFYVFFPLLVFLLPARWFPATLVTVIVAAPLVRFALELYYSERADPVVASDAVYWHTLSHLDAFFMGGLIPVLRLHHRIQRPLLLFAVTLVIAWASGLANYLSAGTTGYFTNLGYNHDEVENYAHVWRYTCLNILFAAFILLLTTAHNRPRLLCSVMEHPVLVRIGKVSYGMYIFHWLVFVYGFSRIYAPESLSMKIVMFIPYLLAVWAVAELSFRLYETYFIRLKDQFFSRKQGVPQPQPKGSGVSPLNGSL